MLFQKFIIRSFKLQLEMRQCAELIRLHHGQGAFMCVEHSAVAIIALAVLD